MSRPATMPPDDSPLMTVEQFGALLGVRRARAHEIVAAGDVPSCRIGKRVYVPRKALDELSDRAMADWRAR